MSTGMKRWLAVVVPSLLLVAVWLLPPRAIELPDRSSRIETEEGRRYERLLDELQAEQRALTRARQAATLPDLAESRATDGVAVLMTMGSAYVTPTSIRDGIETRIRSLDRRDPDMLVGYVRETFGTEAVAYGAPTTPARSDVFTGETSSGTPYCLHVVVTFEDASTTLLDRMNGNGLGGCRLHASYGRPGSVVAGWLERGGIMFATEGRPPVADVVPSRSGTGANVRATLRPTGSLDWQRCLRGDVGVCATVFANPETALGDGGGMQLEAWRSSAMGTTQGTDGATLGGEVPHLLADLESEFGPDAFQRFWSSETELATAFSDAFGTTPGNWLQGWVDQTYRSVPALPGLTRTAGLGSILFITLMSAAVTLLQRRRGTS